MDTRYDSLDKEFQQIMRDAQAGKQIADMLFKVWLNDGGECWLFIHIEIRGSYEKDFARRMFDYNTSAYKLYNREVISLAVLCDEHVHWRPTKFGYGRRGARTEITFPVVKLLDYGHDLELLERNQNPFAVIVLAHLQAICRSSFARISINTRRRNACRICRALSEGDWRRG